MPRRALRLLESVVVCLLEATDCVGRCWSSYAATMLSHRLGRRACSLAGFPPLVAGSCCRFLSANSFRVGDVVGTMRTPSTPSLVPTGFDADFGASASQTTLAHLRWLTQKDELSQDTFLIGPPGPERRRLAMHYCELSQREVEVTTVSRDTTEADLKQRREIVGGSAIFVDQAAVRAAVHGRLLVLDGIEKAERNVLPTLNNLLENREMHLDDGRFLMSHKRFDELLAEGVSASELEAKRIVRCHPDFRVLALGLPVPPFPGKPGYYCFHMIAPLTTRRSLRKS